MILIQSQLVGTRVPRYRALIVGARTCGCIRIGRHIETQVTAARLQPQRPQTQFLRNQTRRAPRIICSSLATRRAWVSGMTYPMAGAATLIRNITSGDTTESLVDVQMDRVAPKLVWMRRSILASMLMTLICTRIDSFAKDRRQRRDRRLYSRGVSKNEWRLSFVD